MRKSKIITCKVGDNVLHSGKKVMVSEVLAEGGAVTIHNKRTKSYIVVCPIMENGQVLKRSPICVGEDWTPIPGRE